MCFRYCSKFVALAKLFRADIKLPSTSVRPVRTSFVGGESRPFCIFYRAILRPTVPPGFRFRGSTKLDWPQSCALSHSACRCRRRQTEPLLLLTPLALAAASLLPRPSRRRCLIAPFGIGSLSKAAEHVSFAKSRYALEMFACIVPEMTESVPTVRRNTSTMSKLCETFSRNRELRFCPAGHRNASLHYPSDRAEYYLSAQPCSRIS
jgi:hypothetical protein